MSGKIKSYTKHYKFIIPEFNVATWHDFVEENFRSIDALFQNLFGINNFSGMWKTNAEYKANQVLFVGEDGGSEYEGRLVKVIQDTNTGGFATFSEAIKRYPTHYEMFADANSAEIYANLSKDWATYLGSTVKTPTGEDTGEYSAKHYAQVAGSHEEACEMYRNLAKTNSDLAKESEVHATEQAQIATTQATNAETSANNAKTFETSAQSFANSSKRFSEASEQSAKDSEYYALISSPPPLLSHIWSDHVLNDIRYLRADTFSWQDADVYDAVYSHLLDDYKNLSAETETIGDYTITFYRANDGHKIVLPNMEETVKNIYNNTGVAWYYILDIGNRRFKLPRTKWGFVGNRNKVGDNVDISNSGSGVKATQSYLYFYVGNYKKSAIEQTAGLKAELLNNKVDTDLNNVQIPHNSIGFAKYSTEVTNCITEIPQDIKLELNNGTLRLKAGSKVYVPNGAGKFDVATVTSDIVAGTPYTNKPIFVYYYNNGLSQADSSSQCSGTSSSIVNGFWYDTTNNFIKRVNNSSASYSGFSFPIAIVSASNGSWVSIDQVFNGFGYIGSTVFALPGVKGLIPNGRNADGTLKNTEFTITRVLSSTFTGNYTGSFYSYWNDARNIFQAINYYDIKTNTMASYDGFMQAGVGYLEGNRVTLFQPKTTFHAVDYNDFKKLDDETVKYSDFTTTQPTTISTATSKNPAVIVENYYNSSTGDWYRVWSDGWIEQGGVAPASSANTITFLKPFSNTNYTANLTSISHSGQIYAAAFERISATQMEIHTYSGANDYSRVWVARGY